jgi:hypothetical protein
MRERYIGLEPTLILALIAGGLAGCVIVFGIFLMYL